MTTELPRQTVHEYRRDAEALTDAQFERLAALCYDRQLPMTRFMVRNFGEHGEAVLTMRPTGRTRRCPHCGGTL